MNLWKWLSNQIKKEYSTKLDGYFFDEKINTTKITLRFRNKRTVVSIPVKSILSNKELLNNFHPIDLCIIGILLSDPGAFIGQNKNNYISISDDFLMIKISNVVEIIGREFKGHKEILKLKIRNLNKTVDLSPNELFENKKVLSAFHYQDALSVGFSIAADNHNLLLGLKRKERISTKLCLYNGLFLSFMIISMLLMRFSFSIREGWILKGEIILLPIMIFLHLLIIGNVQKKNANKFFISTILNLVIFFIYYFWIVTFPSPKNNLNIEAFKSFSNQIRSSHALIYILSFIISGLSLIYKKSSKKLEFLDEYIYILIFFVITYLLERFFTYEALSLFEITYSVILINCLTFMKFIGRKIKLIVSLKRLMY